MLHVFLCEDDQACLTHIETVIKNHILIEDYDMELTLSVDNPTSLLEYLDTHPIEHGLYFLDVDLQHEMDGIVLASKIRIHKPAAKIVFVTNHAELSHLTFRYRIEALDYIVKDNPEEMIGWIKDCIDVAYERYLSDQSPKRGGYQVKAGGQTRVIPFDEILYFESHPAPHKIILHTKIGQVEFYGSLSNVLDINTDFFRCHKSFVVNTKHIRHVSKPKREVTMNNGAIVLVTKAKIKALLDAMVRDN
ncbi:MAG: LytTR family DNA-binding domain-containing protein [Oscillospiraceae bacterium]|nr:LytTR family DNA-binding domain-containing protein [Oscillospiraceae bacterium]